MVPKDLSLNRVKPMDLYSGRLIDGRNSVSVIFFDGFISEFYSMHKMSVMV